MALETNTLVLVIPCFEESLRLTQFLPGLLEAVKDIPCLIQIVDDGSRLADAATTHALVEKWRQRFPAHLAPFLGLPQNQGKGAAIRAGWKQHPNSAQWAFVDADGSISPQEVRRVVDLSQAFPERAYFASRIKMLGRRIDRSPLRHAYARIFAAISSTWLQVPVYDSQCGLKIVPGTVFKEDLHLFQEQGYAFDLELLVALVEKGIPIEEVPIDWAHKNGSKIRLPRDAVKMCFSLHRISRRRAIWTSSTT